LKFLSAANSTRQEEGRGSKKGKKEGRRERDGGRGERKNGYQRLSGGRGLVCTEAFPVPVAHPHELDIIPQMKLF